MDNSHGLYLTIDQQLYKENPDGEDGQGVGLFLQYGWAPKNRSEVDHYLGGGIMWTGPIPGRDDDIAGLAVLCAQFSDQAGMAKPFETAIELFYRIQIGGWISLKPNLQYIVGTGGQYEDAMAGGVRLEMTF